MKCSGFPITEAFLKNFKTAILLVILYGKESNCLQFSQWKVTVIGRNVRDTTSVSDKSNNSSWKWRNILPKTLTEIC